MWRRPSTSFFIFTIFVQVAFVTVSGSNGSEEDRVIELVQKGEELLKRNEYAKAIAPIEEALALTEAAFGKDSEINVGALEGLAVCYFHTGKPEKARQLLERALLICDKKLGPNSSKSKAVAKLLAEMFGNSNTGRDDVPQRKLSKAQELNRLAIGLSERGEFAKAIVPAEQWLALVEDLYGKESEINVAALECLAVCYRQTDQLEKARQVLERALSICDARLGANSIESEAKVAMLAEVNASLQNLVPAAKLYSRLVELREQRLGHDDPLTADAVSNLASVVREQGDFKKARELCIRALNIREAKKGPEDPATALSLNDLAAIYNNTGDLDQAKTYLERALKIRETRLGATNPATIASRNNLAVVYARQGYFDNAAKMLEQVVRDMQHVPGGAMVVAAGLTSLGTFCRDGDIPGGLPKAVALYQEAQTLVERELNHNTQYAELLDETLGDLASLYLEIGDYLQAMPLLKKRLGVDERVFGESSPRTLDSLNRVVQLLYMMGNLRDARQLAEKALTISEKAEGPRSSAVGISLDNLAALDYEQREYSHALKLAQRALDIFQQVPNSPHTAICLTNLSMLHLQKGDIENAVSSLRQALSIQDSLGKNSTQQQGTLEKMALTYWIKGDLSELRQVTTRWQSLREKELRDVLAFGSERQRLTFQGEVLSPLSYFAMLGDADLAAAAVLREKGIVLDSLTEDFRTARQGGDPKANRKKLDEIQVLKDRLFELTNKALPVDAVPTIVQQHGEIVENCRRQIESLESKLARAASDVGSVRHSLEVTPAQVRAALPERSVLIEFILYSHCLGINEWESRYGAVLLPARGDVRWITLGKAKEIDAQISLYQQAVRRKDKGLNPTENEVSLRTILRKIYDQVWQPIASELPDGTHSVILSPDGQLEFVSFATLLAPDESFLAQQAEIRYVASGRDILLKPKEPPEHSVEVFANPDFSTKLQASAAHAAQKRSNESKRTVAPVGLSHLPEIAAKIATKGKQDFSALLFLPLPGTEQEAISLSNDAKDWGWPVNVWVGGDATKARLSGLRHPQVLHIATHGFFLQEKARVARPTLTALDTPTDFPSGTVLTNPMERAGLALAGAQETLDDWRRGVFPPPAQDGILTAEEAGGLDLDGTGLVVLSACDTGGGEERRSEGVMGLRRGFIKAGAENLLMTLWPISDQITVQIMEDFYKVANCSGNPSKALASVQSKWLSDLSRREGLVRAVKLAGPFIMNFQGNP
jgi:CHAT domain-containing protein/tetratricopeptide (TPR) repeat protein